MNFEKMLDDMSTGFAPVDNTKSVDLSSDAIEKKLSDMIDKKLTEMLSNKKDTRLKESERATNVSKTTGDATDDATDATNNNTITKEEEN